MQCFQVELGSFHLRIKQPKFSHSILSCQGSRANNLHCEEMQEALSQRHSWGSPPPPSYLFVWLAIKRESLDKGPQDEVLA